MVQERIDIDVKARLEKVNNDLKLMDQVLKRNLTSINNINTSFQNIIATMAKAGTTINRFNASLREFSRGDIFTRSINASRQLQNNLVKAANAMQILRLSERSQTAPHFSVINDQLKAQEVRVAQAQLQAAQTRSPQNLALLKKEQQVLERLRGVEQQIAEINKRKEQIKRRQISIEQQTLLLQEKSRNAEFVRAQREFTEARVIGDGGASLFRIQTSLLINYTLLNQLFRLFHFGTQFVLDLDKAFRDLQAITVTTEDEMERLKTTLIGVSEETKFTAVEVAEAAKVLGQAGFSSQQIQDAIRGVTHLATAVGSTLKEATDVATSAISVFALRAEDMGHVANIMTGAINNSKLTMEKLALGIQFAGNIASQAGLTFEETTSVLAAMANAGIRSGSTLGTGLRQVLIQLINPGEKFIKNLEEIGLTVEDVDIKSKGFVGVLQTLREAGFTTTDAFESFEVRAGAAFAAIQNDPQIIRDLQQAFLFTTAAAAANEVQMKSLANTFDKFRSILGTVIFNTFEPLKETLVVVTNAVGGMLTALNKMGFVLPLVGSAVTAFGIAVVSVKLGTLVANVVRLPAALTATGVAATSAAGGMRLFGTSIAAIGGPVGLLTIALGALIGTVFLTGTSFKDASDQIDALQANVDRSAGEFEKTAGNIGAVERELGKLTERYAILQGDSDAVYGELVSLTQQFGKLGFQIDNETNPSIDDLIEGLQRLRRELQETSTAQVSQLLTERALLFNERANQARDLLNPNKKSRYIELIESFGLTPGPGARALSRQPSLPQNAFSNRLGGTVDDVRGFFDRAVGFDLNTASRDQIEKFKVDAVALINDVSNDLGEVQKKIAEIKTAKERGDEVSDEFLETYIAREEELKQAFELLNKQAADSLNFLISTRTRASSLFQTTELSQVLTDRIDEFEVQISKMKAELAAEDDPDKRKQMIDEINEKIKEFINESRKVAGDLAGEALDKMQAQLGREFTVDDLSLLIDGLFIKLEGVKQEARNSLGRSVEQTTKAFDKALNAAKSGLEQIKKAYELIGKEFDVRISRFDLIERENSDLARGGLRGRFSDAEIDIFRDRQKQLQIQKLRSQIGAFPGVISGTDALIAQQSRIVASRRQQELVSPSNEATKARIEAERTLLQTQNERKNLVIELKALEQEYAIITGEVEEANISLREQIQYVIEGYREQMEIQSQWAHDIKKNIIEQLDNARSATRDFVKEWVTGTKSISEAFRDMVANILESALDLVTDKLAGQLVGAIFSGFGGSSYNPAVAPLPRKPSQSGGGGFLGAIGSFFGGLFNTGGLVRAATGIHARDSKLALVRPGEFVLRNQAVEMLGTDALHQINAMGARRISAASNVQSFQNGGFGEATVLNVWVVSPDEKPSLTKNDVLVTITEDLRNGGATRKLVKSIQTGG